VSDAGPSRRQFITGSLLFSAAFAGYHAWGRRPWAEPPPSGQLPGVQGTTLVAAFAVMLEDGAAAAHAAAELDSSLDADQLEQLGLALKLLEFAPAGLLSAQRFSRMDPARQSEVLAAWERSRLGVRRQIAATLRKAARFIHFSQPSLWDAMGYDGPWVGE